MSTEPDVTIVVTARERYSPVYRTLPTLVANTSSPHRLVCVVGGAPPAVRQFIASVCDANDYALILADGFLPANAARNLGLSRATTEYVVFLDNDVVVEPHWLEALVGCAEEERADLVSPLCLIGDPANLDVHSMGGRLVIERRNDGLYLQEAHHSDEISLRASPRQLSRLSADYSEFHCALVRRSVFDRIGPLDERILGAAEHIDLALHLRALGSRGFFEPAAVVSYLPTDYTLADSDNYSRRWSDAWYFQTMAHLVEKWGISPEAPLLHDYLESFKYLRERCLVKRDAVAPFPRDSRDLRQAQTIVQLLDQLAACGYRGNEVVQVRQAYSVACELFAGSFTASGRTFLAHLVGTASIMADFGTNPSVVAASVLHSAYAYGRFRSLFNRGLPEMRRWLSRRVSHVTEELVYRYSVLSIDEVSDYFNKDLDSVPIELAYALTVRAASALEDRIAGETRYFDSAGWLRESNSQLQRWLPLFRAIADRFGIGQMVVLLDSVVVKETGAAHSNNENPMKALNYMITPETGASRPLIARDIERSKLRLVKDEIEFETDSEDDGERIRFGAPVAVDLGAICSLNGGIVTRDSDHAVIVTDIRPWAYSAMLRLEDLVLGKGRAEVEVSLIVDQGTIGLAILERRSSVMMITPELSAGPAAQPTKLHFDVPAIEEAGDLIFRSWPTAAEKTKARIVSVTVNLEEKM